MLATRDLQPELMDQPGLDPALHAEALRGLARINRVSRGPATLWDALRRSLHRHDRPWRILDVACGGGDVAIELAALARADGVEVQLGGCDVSPTALDHAHRNAERAGVAFTTHRLDAVNDPLPAGYDAAVCSLFLHHLRQDEAVRLLAALSTRVGCLAVTDLERSRAGLLAARVGTRVLSRSRIVHVDGPLSVRAAFSADEARQLATDAGLRGATVRRVWPFRWLLTWSSP